MKKYKAIIPKVSLVRDSSAGIKKVKITNSKNVYDFILPFYIPTLEVKETMYAVYLNRANNIIGYSELSTGGTTGTIVDVKILLSEALQLLAHGIILVHNHPSGNLQPSAQDGNVTEKVKKACKLLDMALLDHIIIGNSEGGYFSMADEGVI